MGDEKKNILPVLVTAGGAILSAFIGGTCRLLSAVAPVLFSGETSSTLDPAPASNLLYGIIPGVVVLVIGLLGLWQRLLARGDVQRRLSSTQENPHAPASGTGPRRMGTQPSARWWPYAASAVLGFLAVGWIRLK
jgi:hypothetical protein